MAEGKAPRGGTFVPVRELSLSTELNVPKVSQLLASGLPGQCYSRSLPELSVNQLLDPLGELLFIKATGDLHLQKPIQDLSFCHRFEPFNHLDEYGPEVLEKILPLIHTAQCTPTLISAVRCRKQTITSTYFADQFNIGGGPTTWMGQTSGRPRNASFRDQINRKAAQPVPALVMLAGHSRQARLAVCHGSRRD